MTALPTETLHAYRHLYQHVLRAVRFSKPARYIARDRLRAAFRDGKPGDFNTTRIARTLEFLDGAARVRGLEHRIVKNLLRVSYERQRLPKLQVMKDNAPFRKVAYEHFDETVEKLNETMGLCL